MQKYLEALDLLNEYLQEYHNILESSKINKFNAPLFLQYRSEIQELIQFFQENKEDIPFSLYQDFEKLISNLQETDQKLVEILPELKRFINFSHYRTKYPKEHWWWFT